MAESLLPFELRDRVALYACGRSTALRQWLVVS